MDIQMLDQERNLFFLANSRSLKKRSRNENANGQLQRYFPKCTEFIIANYLKQFSALAALLRIINQRSDPISLSHFSNQTPISGKQKAATVDITGLLSKAQRFNGLKN